MVQEFSVQSCSASNDSGDFNERYQCKIVGEDFIEGDNNGRIFLFEWYIILGGSCGIAIGDTSARWCGETSYFLWGVHHFGGEMFDDNIVGKMMHYETLCLTGEVVADRDIMSCCEMAI